LKIVREHREKYKRISAILDENPEILAAAALDLRGLSRGGRKGRGAKYTCENLLRAVLVHTIEGEDLRGTVVRIWESDFLRDFIRLGGREVLDFTFLDRAFKAIRPETWKGINALLALWAREEGRMDPSRIRVDTTVTEATIHYPTDSFLLWDSWRVLARLLRQARSLAPDICPHRFHDRLAKNAHLRITRYAGSSANWRRRFVKRCFRELIGRVRWIARIAEKFARWSRASLNLVAQALGAEIEGFLKSIRVVIEAAERANVKGETVRASERVFSIFEPHTELIRRGKKQKPVEFGHMILIAQTKEKFISDYDVMEKRVPDPYLGPSIIERHEQLYGCPPEAMTADTGFNPQAQGRAALEEKVKTLAIPRKISDWAKVIGIYWQRFRAGIEGSISVLKRAFRLLRCPYRTFKSFAASIGMSVFCHNLVLLARSPAG
jgi:IS5 family transposase